MQCVDLSGCKANPQTYPSGLALKVIVFAVIFKLQIRLCPRSSISPHSLLEYIKYRNLFAGATGVPCQ